MDKPKKSFSFAPCTVRTCLILLINPFRRHFQISAVSTRQVLEKRRYLRVFHRYKIKTEHGRWIDVNLRKIVYNPAWCSGASFKLLVSSVSIFVSKPAFRALIRFTAWPGLQPSCLSRLFSTREISGWFEIQEQNQSSHIKVVWLATTGI